MGPRAVGQGPALMRACTAFLTAHWRSQPAARFAPTEVGPLDMVAAAPVTGTQRSLIAGRRSICPRPSPPRACDCAVSGG